MNDKPDLAIPAPNEYAPPRVEAVLTDEQLAREVQYAGTQTNVG